MEYFKYKEGADLRGCRYDKNMPRLEFRKLCGAIIEHEDIQVLLDHGADLVGIKIGRKWKANGRKVTGRKVIINGKEYKIPHLTRALELFYISPSDGICDFFDVSETECDIECSECLLSQLNQKALIDYLNNGSDK